MVLDLVWSLLGLLGYLTEVSMVTQPGLERHAGRLYGSLHEDDDLKLLLDQVSRRDVVERRVLLDLVDHLQGPDEEDAHECYNGLLQ